MNKTQTKNFIKQIIGNYVDGEDLLPEDFKFMLGVLANHENAEDKIGCGVKRMWVATTIYNNRGFWLERNDGTKTDFSFLRCFTNSSPRTDYLKACRKAVESDIIEFRDRAFGSSSVITCPILNIPVTKHESHVDHHILPFIKIAKAFFEMEKDIKFIHGDGKIGVEFADKEMEKRGVEFNNQRAQLRIISARANLQIKKQKWD